VALGGWFPAGISDAFSLDGFPRVRSNGCTPNWRQQCRKSKLATTKLIGKAQGLEECR
jgi:hypothetical protein